MFKGSKDLFGPSEEAEWNDNPSRESILGTALLRGFYYKDMSGCVCRAFPNKVSYKGGRLCIEGVVGTISLSEFGRSWSVFREDLEK